MDRNRDGRRASIVSSNGFNRRRHRTSGLRDSPDEDGGLELQESVRLRDRVKKDRDRDRDRDRERERERERDLRERSSRSKRRRGERDETSEESVHDDEDEDEEEEENTGGGGGGRSLTPAASSISNHHHNHHGHISNHHHSHSSSFSQQQHNSNSTSNIVSSNHHLQHRKSIPPSSSAAKVSRAPPVWKPGDEMICSSVPRKARSASTKRSHDWISSSSNKNSGGGVSGGEQNLGQATSSPARQSVVSMAAPSPAVPMSPSSSNASIRKKLKPSVNNSGPKLKPPKVSSKPSSSNPGELEIEIAEVLYGLKTQTQGPSSKKEESRDINRLNSDSKSRNSSPVSNSTSTNNPILGTKSAPLSVVEPKRKRPRPVPEISNSGARSAPLSAKPETDQSQTPKSEISSPNLEKTSGSAAENGYGNSVNPQEQPAEPPAPTAPESAKSESESKGLAAKEELSSPEEEESPVVRAEDSNNEDSPSIATASSSATTIKANSVMAEMENRKEEKFEIDLMATPPQVRSSSEREAKMDLADSPVDQKMPSSIADDNSPKDQNSKDLGGKEHSSRVEKKAGEEADSHKATETKGRSLDLHLDLEKSERVGVEVSVAGNKSQLQSQKLQQQQRQIPLTEKSGHSASSLPLPMSMAGWPGGLPPMGYVAPLQGVFSMDGGSVTPGHVQPFFSQSRPKRCATHCQIARNIHCLQQFMKLNPFWPPPAGSATLFGSKPCNLNVIPTGDMHGNITVKGVANSQDKGQSVASLPNNGGKDKGSQLNNHNSDAAQRKQQQILIQQALPPVAPSNLLGPAFIFPLNQQQSAVAARPNGTKSPASGASSNAASSAVSSASSATAMSFNYPNMASNETQYLAILQNGAYPFPIPTVGAPPNYRGSPAQAMPMFNGPFYSSPMIQPPVIQHHQQQSVQSSGGLLSSHKHLQSQQARTQSVAISGGSGNPGLQHFSAQKTQSPQQLPNNQFGHPSQARHLEGEPAGEDSPPTTDNRGSRASTNIYSQNFAMPIHPQNFSLMTSPASLASAATVSVTTSASSNQNDKKTHQQQQPGLKTGPESLPPHGFAMSFGTISGTTASGIDLTSLAQTHAIFQSSSDAAARQNIQMMAAAQAAQKKNSRMSDGGKPGGVDSSVMDDERKSLARKALGAAAGGGQSIAFARQDLPDGSVASLQANSVIESSARSLNVGSRGVSSSRPMTSNTVGTINAANAHNIQAQLQQQHVMQLKPQQLMANRTKVPVTSNGSMYSEHLNSSSTVAAKFPNALAGFPQNLVQSNSSSPTQSPQWKSSTKMPTSQTQSSLASSTTATLKNLPQQHSRTQPQMHTQISFGGSQKQSTTSQGQAPATANQTPSSPMMVGSPTTSSISRGASGSPRTTSSISTNNKLSQTTSLSAQPVKNSPSAPSQKSQSILGNPSGPKIQMQQQQVPKNMQQAQLLFSNPYAQSHPHSGSTSSTASVPSGYFIQSRRPGGPVTSAGGLSLCSTSTNDPATAIAAATAHVTGGGRLPSQGVLHASQFAAAQSGGTLLPAGFSYPSVPAAVQVKPAEQKQPAGDDNVRPWQPEKK